MVRDGEVEQRQHFYHDGDTICHPRSGYVQPNCTERLHVDATIMRYFQTELFLSSLPSMYVGHVNLYAVKPWQFTKMEKWQRR